MVVNISRLACNGMEDVMMRMWVSYSCLCLHAWRPDVNSYETNTTLEPEREQTIYRNRN